MPRILRTYKNGCIDNFAGRERAKEKSGAKK
jgi:hypothetical protein